MAKVDCVFEKIKEIACNYDYDSPRQQALVRILTAQLIYEVNASEEALVDFIPAGTVDGTALTVGYASIFNATNQSLRIVNIYNDTDVDIWISDDGTDDHLFIPAKTSLTLDFTSNKGMLNKQLFVKYATVVGTEGQVIVSGVK